MPTVDPPTVDFACKALAGALTNDPKTFMEELLQVKPEDLNAVSACAQMLGDQVSVLSKLNA
jgi:hypothetical protein